MAAARPVEARVIELLEHLGIEQAHIAAGRLVQSDWHGLATVHPERVASLTLISPQILGPGELGGLASRLLIVSGDQGPTAEGTVKLLKDLPGATSHILRGYEYLPWSDVASEPPPRSAPRCWAFSVAIRRERCHCRKGEGKRRRSPIAFAEPARRWS